MTQAQKKQGRAYEIDYLRIFLTILVILHHVAIAFGGQGHFVIGVKDSPPLVGLALTLFLEVNQSFFMGLYFAVFGYFTEGSLHRQSEKGEGAKVPFIRKRFKRLVVPALIFYLVVTPVVKALVNGLYLGKGVLRYEVGFGVTWFLLALFLFDSLYALLRPNGEVTTTTPPKIKQLVGLFLGVGLVTGLVRMVYPVGSGLAFLEFQPAHFAQYICAYGLGVMAQRHKWYEEIPLAYGRRFGKHFALLLVALFGGLGLALANGQPVEVAMGGGSLTSFGLAVWEQMVFLVLTLGLLSYFRGHLSGKNPWGQKLGGVTFEAYYIHTGVIVGVVMVTQTLDFGLQLLTVSVLSVALSLGLPLAWKWLGSRFKSLQQSRQTGRP